MGYWGEQGFRVSESARLPQMWPRFDLAQCHVYIIMWVEFFVGSQLVPKVFSQFSGFPPFTKTSMSRFQFVENRGVAWKAVKTDMARSLNMVILSCISAFRFALLLICNICSSFLPVTSFHLIVTTGSSIVAVGKSDILSITTTSVTKKLTREVNLWRLTSDQLWIRFKQF